MTLEIKNLVFLLLTDSDTDSEDRLLFCYLADNSRITVLERRKDYSILAVETRYSTKDGKFWLALNFDIRNFPELTVEDAVDMIKRNSAIMGVYY